MNHLSVKVLLLITFSHFIHKSSCSTYKREIMFFIIIITFIHWESIVSWNPFSGKKGRTWLILGDNLAKQVVIEYSGLSTRGRPRTVKPWWHHQMETFSALLALCVGNSPVTGEFPSQRPLTWSFDVFLDLRLNKRLSKQSICRWFKMSPCSLWRHCNVDHNSHSVSRAL